MNIKNRSGCELQTYIFYIIYIYYTKTIIIMHNIKKIPHV